MTQRSARLRSVLLPAMLVVVGANYLAQIPYYLHLYYFPHHASPSLPGTLALGATLVWFAAGFAGATRGSALGYGLLVTFLVAETGFYLANMLNQVAHGYGPFLHLSASDPILLVVFAIGYLNLLAGPVFLYALLRYQRAFTGGQTLTRAPVAGEVASR